jgi:uncharacterized caspase-like protein
MPANTNAAAGAPGPGERPLRLTSSPVRPVEFRNRWAVVVGISQYKFHTAASPLNLSFAHRDAEELYELLLTPAGGAFEAKRIVKLIDASATAANIRKALFSFLKQPARDDLVLIYFACHGAPDPDRPQNVYLVAHDTDPDDISGTGMRMGDIDDALRENLIAERVVLIADTCHSAAIGGKIGARAVDDAAVVNHYLQQLSGTKPGLALLTSAEASERSLEGAQWGGGHGLFTHFLLEGMRGKADTNPKDGTVTVRELFDYVREQVSEAAQKEGRSQHPVIGPNAFDPALPLAVIGSISADEHCDLGCALYRLGWLLDDRFRFAAACRQFDEALRLCGLMREPAPQVHFHRGLAQLALDDHDEAIRSLTTAIDQDKDRRLAEAFLHRGIAHLKIGDRPAAVADLKHFVAEQPQEPRTPFVQRLLASLDEGGHEQRFALLIGINDYSFSPLRGCVNDVEAVHDLLVEQYGFPEATIRPLTDADASRTKILAELDALRTKAKPDDSVVVFFSGHAYSGDIAEYLIPHDFQAAGQAANPTSGAITAQELHDALVAIPARHKLLLIDSHVNHAMPRLAGQSLEYAFLAGAHEDQMAAEHYDGDKAHGRFTFAFTTTARTLPPDTPLDEIVRHVADAMRQIDESQTPLLLGTTGNAIIRKELPREMLAAFDFSQRRSFTALTQEEVALSYAMARDQLATPFPQLHYAYGLAFLEKHAFVQALAALQRASDEVSDFYADATLALSIAELRTQNYGGALSLLQAYLAQMPEYEAPFAEPMRVVEQLRGGRKRALLVGIETYKSSEVPNLRGPGNDVTALQALLVERYGFAEEDVTTLRDGKATLQAIEREFKKLVAQSRSEPALFYFSGHGSEVAGEPAIVPCDGRTRDTSTDILLRDLAAEVGTAPTNLTVIIDAGWTPGVTMPFGVTWGSRYVPPDSRPRLPTRALRRAESAEKVAPLPQWQPDPDWLATRARTRQALTPVQIGRVSLFNVSIQATLGVERTIGGEAIMEAEFGARTGQQAGTAYGVLTYALLETMRREAPNNLTYALLERKIQERLQWLQPFMVGAALDENIFSAPVQEEGAHQLLRERILQEPVRTVVPLLQRLIEQNNGVHADAHLNLGVAWAALGDFERSVAALKLAIDQGGDEPDPEASFQLGRVLFQWNRNLDKAIDLLRTAVEKLPDHAAAFYYLAQAIRARIEQETLVDVANAFRRYLDPGAPLGHRADIEGFLRMREQPQGTGDGSGSRQQRWSGTY